MRTDFINLKEVLEKDDQSKEKILRNIEQNYIKAKKKRILIYKILLDLD